MPGLNLPTTDNIQKQYLNIEDGQFWHALSYRILLSFHIHSLFVCADSVVFLLLLCIYFTQDKKHFETEKAEKNWGMKK